VNTSTLSVRLQYDGIGPGMTIPLSAFVVTVESVAPHSRCGKRAKLGLNVEGIHTITIYQQAVKTNLNRRNLVQCGAQHEAARRQRR
jgi:hypothetical protein